MELEEKYGGLEDLLIWSTAQKPVWDLEKLKEYVRQMVRMLTQKTGGQAPYAKNGDIPFENLERVRMGILSGAVALVRSGGLKRIGCDRLMVKTITPDEVRDERRIKDRDWNDLKLREAYYGEPVDPAILTSMVEQVIAEVSVPRQLRTNRNLRENVICETMAIVLSGRLEALNYEEDAI